MKLPFPLLGSTFIGSLVSLGVAAVIYSVMVPTKQYNEYKIMQRDIDEEAKLLEVEQVFIERKKQVIEPLIQDASVDIKLKLYSEMSELQKLIALREAKLEISKVRLQDFKVALEKTRIWSLCVGVISFFIAIFGFIKWEKFERLKVGNKEKN